MGAARRQRPQPCVRDNAKSRFGSGNGTCCGIRAGSEGCGPSHCDTSGAEKTGHSQKPAKADGQISNEPGIGLTMNYADCAPIFLVDPVNKAIGVGHAGWQGTVKDVPGAMVRAMAAAYGSQPEDLLAGIGPCISPAKYEVDEPVISAVRSAFGDAEALLIPQPDGPRPHFNIPLANQINLEKAGVRHIEHSGLCTATRTDLFFSHRAEKGKTGRFGVVLQLLSNPNQA